MHSLMSVTIDPSVLAVPSVDCTEDDAYRYVETLLDWKILLDEQWAEVYISEQAPDILDREGLYPLRDHLKALLRRHKIDAYNVKEIVTVVNKLLSRASLFEDHYQIKDVLYDRFEINPDVISPVTHTHLQSNLIRCIVLIAILSKYCRRSSGEYVLIMKNALGPRIQVKTIIEYLEHARDDISNLPHSPEIFESEMMACDNFHGLVECFNESMLLVDAHNDYSIQFAIKIALYKYAISQGDDPDWEDITAPVIGSKFRESCRQICSEQVGSLPTKILRAIVKTIKGLDLSETHSLRTGKSGNAPQKIRHSDNAKAWRRDIDRTFHLHYWECANGAIELSLVVDHDTFSIQE